MQTKIKKKQHAQSFKDLKSVSILKRNQKKHKSLKCGQLKESSQSQMLTQIVDVIELIIGRTFQKTQQVQQNIRNFFNQVQGKIHIAQKFQFFMDNSQSFNQQQCILVQSQPITIPKFEVIKSQIINKKPIQQLKMINILTKQIQKKKTGVKEKLNILTGVQVMSSKSIKSTRSNKTTLGHNFKIETIKEEYDQKQRQRKQKEQILAKLKRQYLNKLKEHSPQPRPINDNFRSFFTEPESRSFKDIRNSFIHLRQMNQKNLQTKQKLIHLQQNLMDEAISTKLSLKRNIKNTPNKNIVKLRNFALDQSGQIIVIKKQANQRQSLFKDGSLTLHNSSQTFLTSKNQVSSIYSNSPILLKNQKIKQNIQPQLLLNQNEYQRNQIQSNIIQKIQSILKQGVKINQNSGKHRSTMSMPYVKLPLIGKRQSKQIR